MGFARVYDSMTTLVIVESPAKAKKIQGILGSDVKVVASKGHVRDLPEKSMGIEVDAEAHRFEPSYEVTSRGKQTVSMLRDLVRSSQRVMLATDEDREGEAIAWHLCQVLKLPVQSTPRMVFHEITPKAIRDAFQSPRTVNMAMVNSQQARRLLDRLVGYEASPLLCKMIQKGCSAGRVQSAALRVLSDREQVRETYVYQAVPEITGTLIQHSQSSIHLSVVWMSQEGASLGSWDDAKAQWTQWTEESPKWSIHNVAWKEEQESAPSRYTTSTLQQDASARMHWSSKQVMDVAQKLYEGGHITYHRTDSTAISEDAQDTLHDYIQTRWSDKLIHGSSYHSGSRMSKVQKHAQEAHECIRPTHPATLAPSDLDDAQQLLYRMIWLRTVESVCIRAQWQRATLQWRHPTSERMGYWQWSSRWLMEPGWRQVRHDEENVPYPQEKIEQGVIRELEQHDASSPSWRLRDTDMVEDVSSPPQRYQDGTMVRSLERRGIGRPSTFATIIETLKSRGYMEKYRDPGKEVTVRWVSRKGAVCEEGTRLKQVGACLGFRVTSLGQRVNAYMVENFSNLVQDAYTSHMEEELDGIETHGKDWNQVLYQFYGPFHEDVGKLKSTPRDASSSSSQWMCLGERVRDVGNLSVWVRSTSFSPLCVWGKTPDEPYGKVFLPKSSSVQDWTLDKLREERWLPYFVGNYEDPETHEKVAMYWRRGRYGMYVEMNDKNVTDPRKERTGPPTRDEVVEWLGSSSQKRAMVYHVWDEKARIRLIESRNGPCFQWGSKFASIPSPETIETILSPSSPWTLKQVKDLFSAIPVKSRPRKKYSSGNSSQKK